MKNPGRSVRNKLHTTGSSVRGFTNQVPLVEVAEDPGPQTSGLQLTMRSKEWKNINTHPIVIVFDHHFLTLHWLGNRILSKFYLPTGVGFLM